MRKTGWWNCKCALCCSATWQMMLPRDVAEPKKYREKKKTEFIECADQGDERRKTETKKNVKRKKLKMKVSTNQSVACDFILHVVRVLSNFSIFPVLRNYFVGSWQQFSLFCSRYYPFFRVYQFSLLAQNYCVQFFMLTQNF